MNARCSRLLAPNVLNFCDRPTITPLLLMPFAELKASPGKTPRSVDFPFVHKNACCSLGPAPELLRKKSTATLPESFMPEAAPHSNPMGCRWERYCRCAK